MQIKTIEYGDSCRFGDSKINIYHAYVGYVFFLQCRFHHTRMNHQREHFIVKITEDLSLYKTSAFCQGEWALGCFVLLLNIQRCIYIGFLMICYGI